MAHHRGLATMGVVLLVMGMVAAPGGAVLEGPQMVGVGLPPDSVAFNTDRDNCAYTTDYDEEPGFRYWVHGNQQINDDVELFISLTLSGALEVTDAEAEELVQAIAWDDSNAFNLNEKDIKLVANYLACVGGYDERLDIFPMCSPEVSIDDRNHLDFYLVKYGENDDDDDYGMAPSAFVDTLEDDPRTSAEPRYHYNSFHVTDGRGNELGDPSWPQRTAVGAAHEFGHMLWASNSDSIGEHQRLHGNFSELHAGVAAYVARTTWGPIGGDDFPYAQSLLYLFFRSGGSRAPCWNVAEGNCGSASHGDPEDCMTAYRTRGMFIAYLMEHFHEEDYTDDLLYQWARVQEGGDGLLIRDMCGLARVLDDDGLYSDLGGSPPRPGNYRIRKVFHNYSIAKWLDDPTKSEYYSFGDRYSPVANAGLFRKVSNAPSTCWEDAVPPQFVVGDVADSNWMHVPGNASDPDDADCDGWNDPTNDRFCQDDYCDHVVLRLWGSNYLAFKADTTYYDASKNDRYLQVKIDWEEGALYDSTELWVSVVQYPSAMGDSSLFLFGDRIVGGVATKTFGPEDDGVLINIPEFHEGGNEAAAVIMSLVATSHVHFRFDCGTGSQAKYCLPRYTDWPTDLEYSYSFAVLQEEQGGGGCPFAEVGMSSGFQIDNNVLATAASGADGIDSYRLERRPEPVEGRYGLRLTEEYDDLSQFDRVSLFNVAHPLGTEVCVLSGGEIRSYAVRGSPTACVSDNGTDLLDLVSAADGEVAVLAPDSWIEAEFPFSGRGGGGIGTRGSPGQKIPPWGGRARAPDGNTMDLSPLCYRANPCTSVMPLPGDVTAEGDYIRLRFTAPTEFRIDQLFLAEFDEPAPIVQECLLLSAEHSGNGDCLGGLEDDDGERVQLSRGDVIDLSFAAREDDDGLEHDFVLVTEGYYGPNGEPRALEDASVTPASVSAAHPNPFTDATSVSFEVPNPKGRVSVRVYTLSGRLVRELESRLLADDVYQARWDGTDERGERVASGVYFYQIDAPGVEERRKIVLLH